MSTDANSASSIVYAFEEFEIDSSKRLLFDSNGKPLQLMPKAFDILIYLVKNHQRVIEKDELMDAIWPDTVVEENNLTQNVSSIRKVLGERHRENRFIATVPGKGYKFVADVRIAARGDSIPARSIDSASESLAALPKKGSDSVVRRVFNERFLLISLAGLVVITSVGGAWWWNSVNSRSGEVRSLAVLPFKPLTLDRRDESLEMGMADTLILKLSGVERVRVRPLAAVRRFSAVDQDVLSAGRQLGVDAILDGRLQIADDRIRATVQLLSVVDGRQLWAGQFDEKLTDIFAIQDSITQKVANELKFQLGARSRKTYTESVEAYQLYMRGNLHARRLIRPEVEKAIEFYRKAIESDPGYALAYVEIANANRALVLTGDARSLDLMPAAKAAALKALELDPELADAWAALATSEFWIDWDWKGAEEHYKRAIELDPTNAPSRLFYSHLLSNLGRNNDAIVEIRKAREIEPASLITNAVEGQILFFAGDINGAETVLRRTIDLDGNFWLSHLFITRVYLSRGQWDEAAASAMKAAELSGGSAEAIATAAYARSLGGRPEEARRILGDLTERAKSRYVPAYALAQIYLVLGDKDRTIEFLEKSIQEREPLMVFLKVEPKWDPIRNDPRFINILERMNFY